jgi:hemoglobin
MTSRRVDALTPDAIATVVDTFYGRVQQDPVLGPIFARHIEDWTPHLLRMKAFWRSVLLRTGEFQRSERGAPPVLHAGIADLQQAHFERWLGLFSEVLDGVLAPEPAQQWLAKAQGIGESLWAFTQRRGGLPITA